MDRNFAIRYQEYLDFEYISKYRFVCTDGLITSEYKNEVIDCVFIDNWIHLFANYPKIPEKFVNAKNVNIAIKKKSLSDEIIIKYKNIIDIDYLSSNQIITPSVAEIFGNLIVWPTVQPSYEILEKYWNKINPNNIQEKIYPKMTKEFIDKHMYELNSYFLTKYFVMPEDYVTDKELNVCWENISNHCDNYSSDFIDKYINNLSIDKLIDKYHKIPDYIILSNIHYFMNIRFFQKCEVSKDILDYIFDIIKTDEIHELISLGNGSEVSYSASDPIQKILQQNNNIKMIMSFWDAISENQKLSVDQIKQNKKYINTSKLGKNMKIRIGIELCKIFHVGYVLINTLYDVKNKYMDIKIKFKKNYE